MEAFETLQGGLQLLQDDNLFRLGTDSMVLADFVRLSGVHSAADLGCGGGALALLLLAQSPGLRVTGLELQAQACELARRSIACNGLQARFSLVQGDLRQIRTLLPGGRFDAVVSNPPYFPVGSGYEARGEAFAVARTERCCTPEQLCAAAAYLLRYGGSFSLVHRPERLADLICALRAQRLEPKRLRFVCHHPGAAPSLLLLEARLGGKPGLRLEPELQLFSASGEPTADYRRIYHMP